MTGRRRRERGAAVSSLPQSIFACDPWPNLAPIGGVHYSHSVTPVLTHCCRLQVALFRLAAGGGREAHGCGRLHTGDNFLRVAEAAEVQEQLQPAAARSSDQP